MQVKAAHNQRSRRTAHFDANPLHQRDYLFRSRIKCAHCELRMWGSRRGSTTYYLCQPSHQRGQTPPDHPKTVYVNEHALLWGITDFLATGIYGPDRVAYWERVLATADRDQHDETARVRAQINQQARSVAEVQARPGRQLLNLEAEDLPPQTRKRVIGRIGELEEELARVQALLARLRGAATTAPPDLHTVRELLATFPLKSNELRDLPYGDLRDLLASLDLMVRYDHKHHRVQVSVTLTAGQGDASLLGSGLLRRHAPDQRYNHPLRAPGGEGRAATEGSSQSRVGCSGGTKPPSDATGVVRLMAEIPLPPSPGEAIETAGLAYPINWGGRAELPWGFKSEVRPQPFAYPRLTTTLAL